jgi:hypothetical protein
MARPGIYPDASGKRHIAERRNTAVREFRAEALSKCDLALGACGPGRALRQPERRGATELRSWTEQGVSLAGGVGPAGTYRRNPVYSVASSPFSGGWSGTLFVFHRPGRGGCPARMPADARRVGGRNRIPREPPNGYPAPALTLSFPGFPGGLAVRLGTASSVTFQNETGREFPFGLNQGGRSGE